MRIRSKRARWVRGNEIRGELIFISTPRTDIVSHYDAERGYELEAYL